MGATRTDLFAFGSRMGPRPPRVNIDVFPDVAGMLAPENPLSPRGASVYEDVLACPLHGHFHVLPAGTLLPEEIGLVADGEDVDPLSVHPATHNTMYPVAPMHLDRFIELFVQLPWQYGGKK